jgi:hypothetical protein
MINRDDTEQYIVVMLDGDLEVYDLAGNQKTVNFPRGKAYLDVTTPRTDFELMTVADYTFILNKLKTPAMLTKGNDYVINGTFTADSYWTKGTGWTIASGKASKASGTASTLSQDMTNLLVAGRQYEVVYTVSGRTAGNIQVLCGLSGLGTARSTNATFTETITCAGTLNLYFSADSSFDGDIDTVSVKEVCDSSWTPTAIIWIKNGVADTDYRVTIDGTSMIYTTGTTAAPNTYKTHEIAYQLKTTINSTMANHTATQLVGDQKSSIVKVVHDSGNAFDFSTTDTWGEQAMESFYQDVHDYGDLPPKCFDGIRAHIKGSSMTEGDDYYAEFNEENQLWEETIGWDQDNFIDWTTMPWSLVRESGGDFTFEPVDWTRRFVGDETSAPAPSFIGEPISDIFFYRNRLGMIAGEGVVLSCASDFFNFFRDTVTQVLDTDVIDTNVSHNKVSVLQFAIPYNEDLLLFSNQTQFALTSENYLTPTSVTVDQTTEFENSLLSRPVGAGSYLYFCLERGDYTGVKEYFIDSEKNNRDAADIWSGDEKLQSSWSKWVFDSADTILDIAMIETSVYFVVQRTDGVYLERMDLQSNLEDGNLGFAVHLDRRKSLTGVYSSGDDWTTWTLPYTLDTGEPVVVVRNDQFTGEEGNIISSTTRPSTTTVRATGDYSAYPCYVGIDYEARYRLSEQFVRSGESHSESITEGKLHLQFSLVVFHQSGSFKVQVQPHESLGTNEYVHTVVLGSQQATIGDAFISSGQLKFPVLANSSECIIDLVNDAYLPSSWQAIEWEGIHVMHTSRN